MRAPLLAPLLLLALARAVAAGDPDPMNDDPVRRLLTAEHRHVRPVDARLRGALEDGVRRSATLAQLVRTLDQSDVIVYLETVAGMHPSVAGRMILAGASAGPRYLRIQIAPRYRGDELIALIGHELRHALEVAQSPQVRDDASLIALYRTIGHSGGDTLGAGEGSHHRYDTMAARHTGRLVLTELRG